jgi:hypothetical protein
MQRSDQSPQRSQGYHDRRSEISQKYKEAQARKEAKISLQRFDEIRQRVDESSNIDIVQFLQYVGDLEGELEAHK